MNTNDLSTQPYKGVRDFYPDDMAIQRYLFDVWGHTAESFGFERYDASVLEPSELYKAKGAENEEMVNEQTYTFTDRGDREVTLRPEMTPTVARMIAGKQRELAFPVRWYSIPNLFRYERAQRGRLREHWQLNCDIFGSTDYTSDVEIIALAHQIFMNFGADESMFEIRLNDKTEMAAFYNSLGLTNEATQTAITRLNDRFHKISTDDYQAALAEIVPDEATRDEVFAVVSGAKPLSEANQVAAALAELGITNVVVDRSIARGFDYYTGTIFEIFDTDPENNRSMMGGGRYDNLTGLFGGDPVPGIGFGFGDVTLRNFLESHGLMTASLTSPTLTILPMDAKLNLDAQKLAAEFRAADISVSVDISDRKFGKKLDAAGKAFVDYVIVLGEDEINEQTYTLKNLTDGTETTGNVATLITQIEAGFDDAIVI